MVVGLPLVCMLVNNTHTHIHTGAHAHRCAHTKNTHKSLNRVSFQYLILLRVKFDVQLFNFITVYSKIHCPNPNQLSLVDILFLFLLSCRAGWQLIGLLVLLILIMSSQFNLSKLLIVVECCTWPDSFMWLVLGIVVNSWIMNNELLEPCPCINATQKPCLYLNNISLGIVCRCAAVLCDVKSSCREQQRM